MRFVLPAVVALVLVPGIARADYEAGTVPDGTNAFVHGRRTLHLSLLGTSELGITGHTEIGTYLLADAMLFPNLRLEHQLDESEHSAASFMLGVGGGALPFAVGGILPVPAPILVGGGGAGFAWAAMQTATLVGTVRSPEHGLSVSLNGGGFAMEGGFAAVFAGGGVGGGGVGGTAGTTSAHGSRLGMTVGAEMDMTFGRHDALVVAVDAWKWKPLLMDSPNGLIYPRINWTHQFRHWQLTGGIYQLLDTPKFQTWEANKRKMPVSPFLNVAWNY